MQRFRITGNWRQTRERKSNGLADFFCWAGIQLGDTFRFPVPFLRKAEDFNVHNADSAIREYVITKQKKL